MGFWDTLAVSIINPWAGFAYVAEQVKKVPEEFEKETGKEFQYEWTMFDLESMSGAVIGAILFIVIIIIFIIFLIWLIRRYGRRKK